jgi:hypothetical protein
MNKGLFVLLFPVTLLSWGTLHAQQKRDKRKVVLTNSVIYDERKWKTSSGIIPALFPIKSPNSERVIEQLHNSELLRNSSINTTFDVAMVIEKDGYVSSYTTSKSAHPLVAKEVIRLLKPMPRATPAVKNGKPVRFRKYYNFSYKSTTS